MIKGKTTAVDVAPKHDLTVADVEGWVQRYLYAGEEAMRAKWDAERGQLHAKIGDQALYIAVLRKAHRIVGKDFLERIS